MSAFTDKPIVVMAGGTGGHVFPALAVADRLRERGEKIVWFGTRNGIEARVVPAADIAIEWLNVQGLRGKGLLRLLVAPFRLGAACWQALRLLRRIRPKAVLGMGGFVAGPGGLMAWLLNIPLILHEQNSVTGLTNRILSRFATRRFFAFPEAAEKTPRGETIGNPIRADIAQIEDPQSRLRARAAQPLQLLVIGGSLGAAALNRILPQAIQCLDGPDRPLIRHQCGEQHRQQCQQNYREAKVEAEVVSFIDDMREAYSWADLVVCRAGAITVTELCAAGLGSILIPFPYAVDNHQFHNARHLEKQGAADIFIEAELSAEKLALKIRYYQQNRELLLQMANRARGLFQADATERLVEALVSGGQR